MVGIDELELGWWRCTDDEEVAPWNLRDHGLTLVNVSPREQEAIMKWADRHPDTAMASLEYDDPEYPKIGSPGITMWFETLDLMAEFFDILRAFPRRSHVLVVRTKKVLNVIPRDNNFLLIKPDEDSRVYHLGLSDLSETDLTMIRLVGA